MRATSQSLFVTVGTSLPEPEVAITTAIARIGTGPRMTFYWNELEVVMVDALTVANPSQSLAMRGAVATGALPAQIPY